MAEQNTILVFLSSLQIIKVQKNPLSIYRSPSQGCLAQYFKQEKNGGGKCLRIATFPDEYFEATNFSGTEFLESSIEKP